MVLFVDVVDVDGGGVGLSGGRGWRGVGEGELMGEVLISGLYCENGLTLFLVFGHCGFEFKLEGYIVIAELFSLCLFLG
jgi:hypothetical protein